MATIKFWQEMQKVVTIDGQDKLMIGKNSTGEAQYVNVEDLNQFLTISGDSMPAIQGGITPETAVELPAGPTGQNRFFDASWGYWKYNNIVLKNPNGTDGIPEGSDGQLYWNGLTNTWIISKIQALPIQEGVDILNPYGNSIPTEKAVADYVKDNTATVTIGKNKFNPEKVINGEYLDSVDGRIVIQIGWAWSGLIDLDEAGIEVGQSFTWSSDKTRTGATLFKEDGTTPERYLNLVVGTATRAVGEKYFGFNLKSPGQPNWTWAQFEKGSIATTYETYRKQVLKDNVQDLNETILRVDGIENVSNDNKEKLENISVETIESTNKLNPDLVSIGKLLSLVNGTLVASAGYNVTDFISVVADEYIEILNNFNGTQGCRNVVFFSESKAFVSSLDLSTFPKLIQVPNNAIIKFARFTVPNQTLIPNYIPENVGIFHGQGNDFEAYSEGSVLDIENDADTSSKNENSIATIVDVKNLISSNPSGNALSYSIFGGALKISDTDGFVTVLINNQKGYGGNNMMNFGAISYAGLSYTNGDDAAPIHAQNTTIGANHGAFGNLATIASHGLSNVDIGTAFTQGSLVFYLARIVSATQVVFIGEKRGADDNPTFDVLATGTLTRNSINYTVSAVNNQYQIFPSIKNLNLKVYVDGNLIDHNLDFKGSGEVVEIVESYEIKTLQSILVGIKARVGQSTEPTFDGEGFIKIENNYRFVEDLTCIVNVRTRQLKRMTFADIMGAQADLLGTTNDGTVKLYVPNSNPLNGSVDLRKPTALTWTNALPVTYVVIADQPDISNPPSRIIEYKNNTGFQLGYLKNKGIGKDIPSFTAKTFEIRNNTGKLYPHPVEATKVGVYQDPNEVYNISLFRSFTNLNNSRLGNRLSYFTVKDNDDFFVYIDYSGSMFDEINLQKPNLNGKKIEVVETKNCILKSDIYNDGLIIDANYVEGETCFMVVKII